MSSHEERIARGRPQLLAALGIADPSSVRELASMLDRLGEQIASGCNVHDLSIANRIAAQIIRNASRGPAGILAIVSAAASVLAIVAGDVPLPGDGEEAPS